MHGYLSSGASFYRQIKFFGREFEVFAPDLKGFGDNPNMEYPYSLSDYIEEVKEYMYKKGIVKPSVIAHSFGGRIAIKAASGDKNLFDKLVLTGAAGLKPKRTFKKTVKKTVFSVLKKFVPKEKLSAFYSEDYKALSPVMRESFIRIVNEYLDDRLRFIENPTLIINGEKDKETPPYTAKRLKAGIRNSELVFVKNAGHFCFIDAPAKFNSEVREFLLEDYVSDRFR